MGRASTGTVRPVKDRDSIVIAWEAKFTRADGSRTPWLPLDPKLATDEASAKREAASMAPLIKARSENAGAGETIGQFATRWLATRKPKTARDNGSHLKHHILPSLGESVLIVDLKHDDGDRLVAYLDAKIADGSMSAKTASNVWGTARTMFGAAAHAKPATGLRCLDADPFEKVQPPNGSEFDVALQFLYPTEFLQVMNCPDVPFGWKANIAIAVFMGLRDGEQRALRWEHVDLVHGIVTVCETFDRFDRRVRAGTKTGKSRPVPILPPLMPLLEQMHHAAGGEGYVCKGMKSQRTMARSLRAWLRVADVTRPELFTKSAVNRPIRWHDLRATTASWLCGSGRTMVEVRDVLGHTETEQTDRYTRNGTLLRSGRLGEPFPALPAISSANRSGTIRASRSSLKQALFSGVDGTRTRGLRRDRPAL